MPSPSPLSSPQQPSPQQPSQVPPPSAHRAALVVRLDELGRDDGTLAGGKGANLGELVSAGFPVPGGFVVTTHAYDTAMDAAGLRRGIPELLASDGRAVREAVTAVRLPQQLVDDTSRAYAELGSGAVAVRSSATAEDLPGAAFAGQQDTYLGVTGIDSVLDAVRKCWASLWNERAIAYRARLGIPAEEVSIAVVVQRMVPAEVAGVMFTADPVTGIRHHFVVDASTGLGEAVVSGLVTPDHYLLDRSGRMLEWSPGRREVVIGADGERLESQPHDDAGRAQTAPLLPAPELRALAALGKAVAAHFGAPQDIEWAIAEGKLWVLQARPVTALPIPQRLNRVQRLLGSVFSDYFSVRPYPLDMSTWIPYGPLGLMDRVLGTMGIHSNLGTILPEEDGVVVQFTPPMPHPTWRVLLAPFSVLARARRYDPARWREDASYAELEARRREFASLDLRSMPWSELVKAPRRAMSVVDPVTDLRTRYLPGMGVAIVRLRFALARLHRGTLMADLIVGAPTATSAGNDRLEALGAQVRSDADVAALFASRDASGILDSVRTDAHFAAFAAAFDSYLADYGYRETTSPVLVSPPTWSDSPEMVIDLIRMLATDHEERPAASRALKAEALLFRHRRLRSPRRRDRMRARIDAARAGIAFREDSHDAFMRVTPGLRHALLEIGERLYAAAVLQEPFDVFHLRLEEIESIADDSAISEDRRQELAETVRARALKREQLAAVSMVDYAAIFGRARNVADALATGTPACAGRATGAVRVVRSPEEFGTVRPGDILVCPYTNPSWTPLFQRVAAVVVDTGGTGSHAAIVARENGIPAVMGTGDGTRVLSTGQRVTVDGSAGTVVAA